MVETNEEEWDNFLSWEDDVDKWVFTFDPMNVFHKSRHTPIRIIINQSDIHPIFIHYLSNGKEYVINGKKYKYKIQSELFNDLCIYGNDEGELKNEFTDYLHNQVKERNAIAVYEMIKEWLIVVKKLENHLYNRISRELGSYQIERERISPELRHKIKKKYDFRCNDCKKHEIEDDAILEIDHIIPLNRGGTNSEDNLQVLCQKCNREKFNK